MSQLNYLAQIEKDMTKHLNGFYASSKAPTVFNVEEWTATADPRNIDIEKMMSATSIDTDMTKEEVEEE